MIGDSQLGVDHDGNIHIKDVEFPATKGLWELLTRKKVDNDSVTSADLKQYKAILKMTNAHLEGYKPHIHTFKGNKFSDVISKLFPGGPRQSGVETALRREWITYKLSCCADCTPILLHRQRSPAYTSFNRQLDTPLLVNNKRRRRKRQLK